MLSPSTRRAWIEIIMPETDDMTVDASPSTRRAWIEIFCAAHHELIQKSPSTRRAWIEIQHMYSKFGGLFVALHPEGVDRNTATGAQPIPALSVALHPEGVDRNSTAFRTSR